MNKLTNCEWGGWGRSGGVLRWAGGGWAKGEKEKERDLWRGGAGRRGGSVGAELEQTGGAGASRGGVGRGERGGAVEKKEREKREKKRE
jgi:hypothetical protein